MKKLRLFAAAAIVTGLSTLGVVQPADAKPDVTVIECYGCQGCDLVVNGKHIVLWRIPCAS